jgi:hypothetical protein
MSGGAGARINFVEYLKPLTRLARELLALPPEV